MCCSIIARLGSRAEVLRAKHFTPVTPMVLSATGLLADASTDPGTLARKPLEIFLRLEKLTTSTESAAEGNSLLWPVQVTKLGFTSSSRSPNFRSLSERKYLLRYVHFSSPSLPYT